MVEMSRSLIVWGGGEDGVGMIWLPFHKDDLFQQLNQLREQGTIEFSQYCKFYEVIGG